MSTRWVLVPRWKNRMLNKMLLATVFASQKIYISDLEFGSDQGRLSLAPTCVGNIDK